MQRSLLPPQNSPFLPLKTFRSSSIVSDMIQVTATIHANSIKHTPRTMFAHCSLLLNFISRLCHTPSIPPAMDTLISKCDFDLQVTLQETTLNQVLYMHFNVIGLTNSRLLVILIKQEDLFLTFLHPFCFSLFSQQTAITNVLLAI